jgi:hypothetical protein
MKWIVQGILFAMIGAFMRSAGITLEDWQHYAIIVCAAAACAMESTLK